MLYSLIRLPSARDILPIIKMLLKTHHGHQTVALDLPKRRPQISSALVPHNYQIGRRLPCAPLHATTSLMNNMSPGFAIANRLSLLLLAVVAVSGKRWRSPTSRMVHQPSTNRPSFTQLEMSTAVVAREAEPYRETESLIDSGDDGEVLGQVRGGSASKEDGKSSTLSSVFNLVNNVAGAGILTLAAGMATGTGWIPAVGICSALGALGAHTFTIIGEACELTGEVDFKVRRRDTRAEKKYKTRIFSGDFDARV